MTKPSVIQNLRFFIGLVLLATMLAVSSVGCAPALVKKEQEREMGEKQAAMEEPSPKKSSNSSFKPFEEVTKNAKHIPGLLDLYHDDRHLYAALKPGDFDRPMLAPISVAQGGGAAGKAFNFDEQWILAFRREGDQVHLIRKNYRYTADETSPLAKAVRNSYLDSTLMVLDLVSDDAPDDAILVDLSDVYFSNFANLKPGTVDSKRSRWKSVKGFPNNIELQVEVTFSESPLDAGNGINGDLGYVDSRGITLVLHYSLAKLPAGGYRPRKADPRLGHFVCATKNFSAPPGESLFDRKIARWRLEKADPTAEISLPKQQIVWWIEDTVPTEYRPHVKAAILEWNKAFEKIGFRQALVVRWQGEQDKFDPEDLNYCVFRWVTSPHGYAMSNIRTNPITGEIVDGDILFDSSWVRYWENRRAYLAGTLPNDGDENDSDSTNAHRRLEGDVMSPIMAAHYGYGSPNTQRSIEGDPSAGCRSCQHTATLSNQLALAVMSQAKKSPATGGHESAEDIVSTEKGLPDAGVAQMIRAVIMHEVGHSLGLKHNFKGSNLHPLSQMHDKQLTSSSGLVGSVMDYAPLNLALHDQQQGDYATTTLGPYDYWAIEYAYKPFAPEKESAELAKIAARSAEPQLAYASDEDYQSAHDPYVNQYDLGADPLNFAKHRVALATETLAKIDDELIQEGESWVRLRSAVMLLLRQYGDAAFLATRFIGGRQVSHDSRGTPGARDPIVPVASDQQREALKFLSERILIDQPVPLRPQLLRKLATEQWTHWGADGRDYEGRVGLPYFEHLQAIQEIAFAETLGSGERMRLVESNEALSLPGENPLTLQEIFNTFDNAIWAEVQDKLPETEELQPDALALPKTRRNLQRTHVKYLRAIVESESKTKTPSKSFAMFDGKAQAFPNEARSLARQSLKTIQSRIIFLLKSDSKELSPVTLAHLEDVSDEISQALDSE
ncbi:zinc-dependent metalloprotease [Adhaeretor mobilis]|uniref:DUF5117 domain-containing protein n=1 Tax=Adhaeretor mobilis TaxID=1930276 RepID=A0A517MZB1_9BACT|nr:zinc-dependent metalloprotease [Adhaeretor mobilis]QDT00226.1 hypothetical protein HG15A2_35620 [Adhaeretor mobilis]